MNIDNNVLLQFASAILIFLAALIPIARAIWAKINNIEDKRKAISKATSYLYAIFYGIAFTVSTQFSLEYALILYVIGWITHVIAFLTEEEFNKGAVLALIISTVAISFIANISMNIRLSDIDAAQIEQIKELITIIKK